MINAGALLRIGLLGGCLFLHQVGPVAAADIVATGSATIVNGDVRLARMLAYRDALMQASAQQSSRISASSQMSQGQVIDTLALSTSSAISAAQIIDESISGDSISVTVRASLQEGAAGTCNSGLLRKLLVTGLYFQHPEQLDAHEAGGYPWLLPMEVRKSLGANARVLAEHSSANIYISAQRAPLLRVNEDSGDFQAVALARQYRAQYVLSGVIREFGADSGVPALRLATAGLLGKEQRSIVVDAYIHDGLSGTVLATKTVTVLAQGDIHLRRGMVFGSAEFYKTDLGQSLREVITQLAQWAETTVACKPFSARVLKVEGKRIFVDVGAESHLAIGDVLSLFNVSRDSRIKSSSGELLGEERRPAASLTITAVYPQFSVGQVDAAPRLPIQAGDELFVF